MSSFNPAGLETDRLLAPVQMDAAARRNQAIQHMGTASLQAAGAINDARFRAADLSLRTAQVQQQAIESDARIASFQQEQELNTYKLQQMMALDQAGMSRHQVEQSALTTKMLGLQVKEAESKAKMFDATFEGSVENVRMENARLSNMLWESPEEAYAAGMGKSPDGRWIKVPKEENERQQAAYVKSKRDQRIGTGARSVESLSLQLDRLADFVMSDEFINLAPEVQEIIRGNLETMARQQQEALGTPKPQPQQPGNDSGNKPSRRTVQTNMPKEAFDAIANGAMQAPEWAASPVWTRIGQDQVSRQRMSQGIAAYAGLIAATQGEGGQSALQITVENAPSVVMSLAEKSPDMMAILLAVAGDDDDAIRMKVETLFPNAKKQQITMAMQNMRAYLDHYKGK